MSGILGMLKGKATSRVLNGAGGQGQAPSQALNQGATVADQLFEEIFQPVETPADDTEVLQTLINLFQGGSGPRVGY